MESTLDEMLQVERQQLETEARDLQQQQQAVQGRLSVVQRRLEHVRGLLEEEPPQGSTALSQVSHGNTHRNRSHVCDIAESVLNEHGSQPMYYKDLATEVVRRGGVLNGASPGANLTARLVNDDRFVRPTAKGFYALRKDYPNARNVGARRQRRRAG